MHYKRSILITLLFFISIAPALAQDKHIVPANATINKYNNWLKTVHLDQLINASSISKSDSLPSSLSLSPGHKRFIVLTLTPSRPYNDPRDFASAWVYICKLLRQKHYDIYQALFVKMTDYSHEPPEDVIVRIKTANPEIYSLYIYNNQGTRHEENIILGKGANKNPSFDARYLLASPLQGYCPVEPGVTDLRPYVAVLEKKFKGYKHVKDSIVRISREVYLPEMVRLKVYNLYGQITEGRYHEIIYLTMNLLAEKNSPANVRYNMEVLCAGGILSPPQHEKNFKDASTFFSDQLLNYNNSFQEELRKVLNNEK